MYSAGTIRGVWFGAQSGQNTPQMFEISFNFTPFFGWEERANFRGFPRLDLNVDANGVFGLGLDEKGHFMVRGILKNGRVLEVRKKWFGGDFAALSGQVVSDTPQNGQFAPQNSQIPPNLANNSNSGNLKIFGFLKVFGVAGLTDTPNNTRFSFIQDPGSSGITFGANFQTAHFGTQEAPQSPLTPQFGHNQAQQAPTTPNQGPTDLSNVPNININYPSNKLPAGLANLSGAQPGHFGGFNHLQNTPNPQNGHLLGSNQPRFIDDNELENGPGLGKQRVARVIKILQHDHKLLNTSQYLKFLKSLSFSDEKILFAQRSSGLVHHVTVDFAIKAIKACSFVDEQLEVLRSLAQFLPFSTSYQQKEAIVEAFNFEKDKARLILGL